MSRVCWDSMLFIYLVENHPTFSGRARQLLDRAYRRGDTLFTTCLSLGEVLAGVEKSPQPQKTMAIRETLSEMGFYISALRCGSRRNLRQAAGQR